MTVEIRAVRQAVNTATGNQDFNVSGWSAAVQAALYIATYATADNSAADHSVIGLGLATSSSQRHTGGVRDEHDVGTTDCSRRTISDECIVILDPVDGSVDGEADFVQFNAGGSRVTWGAAPSAAFLMTALYFSGFDNVNLQKVDMSGTSPQTVTIGFEADIVINISANGPNADTVHINSELGMGFATWNGATVRQGHIVGFGANGEGAASPRRGIRNDSFWGGSGDLQWTYRLSIGSFTETGFDLTRAFGLADTSDDWFILSLKLPSGLSAWCGDVESPTSTGTDPQTGPGFTPQALIGLLSYIDTINTWGAATADAGTWGVAVATASEEFCHTVQNEDGVGNTNTQSLVDDTLINLSTDAGAAGLVAYLDSFDANGWTPYYTTVDAVTPRQQIWLAIEEDSGDEGRFGAAIAPKITRSVQIPIHQLQL